MKRVLLWLGRTLFPFRPSAVVVHGVQITSFCLDVTCENPLCKMQGSVINTISGIPAADVDTFCESWCGDDEADHCPRCRVMGILQTDYPYHEVTA